MPTNGKTSRTLGFFGGVGTGAAALYFLDPESGGRRRALVRDKVTHTSHAARELARKGAVDLENRAHGLAAEARHLLEREEGTVDDRTLVERVRARIGRVTRHPGAIDVTAHEGRITVSGPILASEAERLLASARRVRGVHDVEDRLERHETARTVPALQGGIHQESEATLAWTPAKRLIGLGAGASYIVYGALRRGLLGGLLATCGALLIARCATNRPLTRLIEPA